MPRCTVRLVSLAVAALITASLPRAADAQEPVRDLRIDPLLFVSVKEYRHILETIGPRVYPGWTWNTVPLLLYRPHVQDVLLNVARPPRGFGRLIARTVLADRVIYARNDSTIKDADGQNTSMTLDDMRVLVVADRYSRQREQLRAVLRQPDSLADRWLDQWNFIPSPYDELQLLLHESFHVHQDRLAPGKSANEHDVTRYPLLDPRNNALVALEARLLRDAVLATAPGSRRARVEQFVAVRSVRRATLDSASVAYENLNEFAEGTARYVELRFLQLGESVTPIPEMYLHAGFTGYQGVLRRLLERRMDDMVKVASFSDDRFGNRFGAGPMRFRLYDTGGAQALLLDDMAPEWKRRIFEPGVYLTGLLNDAIPHSADRRDALVRQAQLEYGYDTIFVNRQSLEHEGRRLIQQRVEEILSSSKTLVTVSYGVAGDITGMGYTPFGVTAVDNHSVIYDLVPIAMRFSNGVVLRMKSVVPVLIDRQAKTVVFAVASPAALFEGKGPAGLDLPELTLDGSPATTIAVTGHKVRIELR